MDRQPDLNELQPLARVIAEKIHTVPVRHCAGGTEDLIAALTLAVAIYVSREVLPPGLPAAVTVPAPAPTDQAALAKLIADAVQGVLPTSSSLACEVVADAVLTVLPAPADRAAILRAEADRIDETREPFPIAVQNGITWATAEMRRHAAECPQCGSAGACNGGPCPLLPSLADAGSGPGRAAGETQQDEARRCVCGDPIEWMDHPDGSGWIHSPGSNTPCLNAREAQQDEMQARPPRTEWQIEFHWRGHWEPDGPAWAQRDNAATRYASVTRAGERAHRLVRQETTYTVVAEYQPSQEPTP